MLTYYHPLDVVPGGVEPLIHASQGDTNTRIAFELFARTGNFFLQGGTEVNIKGKRSDGQTAIAPAFISNGRIYVTLTEDMTAAPGKGLYEVVLTKSGKRMGTANFILMVEARP